MLSQDESNELRGVPGLFWHPWWVYLMVLYSALLNGSALLAQILPYGVFEQPP